MVSTITKLDAEPSSIANDGIESSKLSATVVTQEPLTMAEVPVQWSVTGGKLKEATTMTDENGVAHNFVTAVEGATLITVTAATDDYSMDKTISTYKALSAPIVLNASEDDNYTLDHYDINFGVQAEIPIYSGVELNQTVKFFWDDIDEVSFFITEDVHPPFIIDVTNDLLPDCLNDGTYNIYYEVSDPAGNSTKSSILNITVADGGGTVPSLPEAEVAEADPYINVEDALDGVDVVIEYPYMKEGEQLTLYWNGFDSSGRKIKGTEFSEDRSISSGSIKESFVIPMDSFYPNGRGYEGYSEVYYTVRREGSSSLELSDTRKCLIDTKSP